MTSKIFVEKLISFENKMRFDVLIVNNSWTAKKMTVLMGTNI